VGGRMHACVRGLRVGVCVPARYTPT
jgi:hypothetical protein